MELLITDHLLLDTGHFVPWIKTNFCSVGTRVTSFDEASVDGSFRSRRGVVSLGRHSFVGMVLYSCHTQNFGSWDGCHLILNVEQSGLLSVVARVLLLKSTTMNELDRRVRLIESCLRLMPAIWIWKTLRLVVRARLLLVLFDWEDSRNMFR